MQSGDTLTSISQKTGMPVAEIQALNPEVDPQILIAGEDPEAAEVSRRRIGAAASRSCSARSLSPALRGRRKPAKRSGAKPSEGPAGPRQVLGADRRPTGEVLTSHAGDERRLIASTTKLMTAYVAMKDLPLDEDRQGASPTNTNTASR